MLVGPLCDATASAVFPRLYFQHGSAELILDSAFYKQRDSLLAPEAAFRIITGMIEDMPTAVLGIRGYIDSSEATIPGLALARCQRVREDLEKRGIACERLRLLVIGLGESPAPSSLFLPANLVRRSPPGPMSRRMVDFQLVGTTLPSTNEVFHWNERCCREGAVNRELIFVFAVDDIKLDYPENSALLDTVIQFMRAMPSVELEVGQHLGGYHRMQRSQMVHLTQMRAEAIVNKLIENGIDSKRLVSRGYGDMEPLIVREEIAAMERQEKEQAHRMNRRTEFKIIRCN